MKKLSKTQIHLGIDCYPQRRAWYVFCVSDMLNVEIVAKYKVTECIEEVTCSRCKKQVEEFDKVYGMLDLDL